VMMHEGNFLLSEFGYVKKREGVVVVPVGPKRSGCGNT